MYNFQKPYKITDLDTLGKNQKKIKKKSDPFFT